MSTNDKITAVVFGVVGGLLGLAIVINWLHRR